MEQDNFSHFEDWSGAEERIDRAHELYDNGQMQEALRELQDAIEINPANGNWHFNKGLALDTLGRYSEAIEAFEQARELNIRDPEVLNCLGVDYTRLGKYDLALRVFEELEGLAPDFEPGYCNRIITYSEMGQHDEADQMFYLARQLKEHCPLCYYNMGNSLFSRQDYDRAIWCWQQTREIDSNHPQIAGRIAQAYWAQGDHQMAKEYFIMELRHNPGDIEILLDTGILLLEMNELDAAREKFHRVLELDPEHAQAHHYLGELLLNTGQLAKAAERFHRVLVQEPHRSGAHFRLGQCYLKLGQAANAREHLLAELKNSPEQPEILLELGCLLPHEAMNWFERVSAARPEDAQGFHNLSLCYYHNGLESQGMDLSRRVLELQPDHVLALHNLAFAHLEKGEYDRADDYIRRAADLVPTDYQIVSHGWGLLNK